jgi:hypothetical protein
MFERLRQIRDAFNWGLFAYRVIVLLAATGILSAVGGTVWAVLTGVPFPIAFMAGYCTLAVAVLLAIAPFAYQGMTKTLSNLAPIQKQSAKQPHKSEPPNYSAERLRPDYELGDAAHLWCDVDPNASGTYDTSAWHKVLRAKVQDRTLKINTKWQNDRRMEEAEIADADSRVRIKRASLQEYAKSLGTPIPKFLLDKD